MKKGKKRLLLGWICLLLSLCMVTAASAETDGTPIQPCHQVTMTEQKSTAQNGASISVWHITTALGTVDAELNALADDYAAELSPLLQKPGRERTLNSSLTVRILHSRTGMSWMSFMVQARQEHDEGHAIATHFYEHLYANQEQGGKFRAMYDKVNRAHIAAIGIAPAYARAPGGQWQRMGSYGVGWPLIQWTAEAQDWSGGDQGPDAYRTANTIAASTKDGGIILMHDMKINSAKATEMFIPKLEERGFMLLTVDELFAKDGVTLEANQAYWRCLDGVTTQY